MRALAAALLLAVPVFVGGQLRDFEYDDIIIAMRVRTGLEVNDGVTDVTGAVYLTGLSAPKRLGSGASVLLPNGRSAAGFVGECTLPLDAPSSLLSLTVAKDGVLVVCSNLPVGTYVPVRDVWSFNSVTTFSINAQKQAQYQRLAATPMAAFLPVETLRGWAIPARDSQLRFHNTTAAATTAVTARLAAGINVTAAVMDSRFTILFSTSTDVRAVLPSNPRTAGSGTVSATNITGFMRIKALCLYSDDILVVADSQVAVGKQIYFFARAVPGGSPLQWRLLGALAVPPDPRIVRSMTIFTPPGAAAPTLYIGTTLHISSMVPNLIDLPASLFEVFRYGDANTFDLVAMTMGPLTGGALPSATPTPSPSSGIPPAVFPRRNYFPPGAILVGMVSSILNFGDKSGVQSLPVEFTLLEADGTKSRGNGTRLSLGSVGEYAVALFRSEFQLGQERPLFTRTGTGDLLVVHPRGTPAFVTTPPPVDFNSMSLLKAAGNYVLGNLTAIPRNAPIASHWPYYFWWADPSDGHLMYTVMVNVSMGADGTIEFDLMPGAVSPPRILHLDIAFGHLFAAVASPNPWPGGIGFFGASGGLPTDEQLRPDEALNFTLLPGMEVPHAGMAPGGRHPTHFVFNEGGDEVWYTDGGPDSVSYGQLVGFRRAGGSVSTAGSLRNGTWTLRGSVVLNVLHRFFTLGGRTTTPPEGGAPRFMIYAASRSLIYRYDTVSGAFAPTAAVDPYDGEVIMGIVPGPVDLTKTNLPAFTPLPTPLPSASSTPSGTASSTRSPSATYSATPSQPSATASLSPGASPSLTPSPSNAFGDGAYASDIGYEDTDVILVRAGFPRADFNEAWGAGNHTAQRVWLDVVSYNGVYKTSFLVR